MTQPAQGDSGDVLGRSSETLSYTAALFYPWGQVSLTTRLHHMGALYRRGDVPKTEVRRKMEEGGPFLKEP